MDRFLFPSSSKVHLCSWCKKVVLDESGSISREFSLASTDYKVDDFESHGICKICRKALLKESGYVRSNPPVWIRNRGIWKQALSIAGGAYRGKSTRKLFAVAVQVYRNLGGEIRSKARPNPTAGELDAVLALFREWQEFDANVIEVFEVPDKWPVEFAQLGRLVEIVYESDKWDGRKRLYSHRFGEKPVLVSSKDGRLFILGGNYKIKNAGIVG